MFKKEHRLLKVETHKQRNLETSQWDSVTGEQGIKEKSGSYLL